MTRSWCDKIGCRYRSNIVSEMVLTTPWSVWRQNITEQRHATPLNYTRFAMANEPVKSHREMAQYRCTQANEQFCCFHGTYWHTALTAVSRAIDLSIFGIYVWTKIMSLDQSMNNLPSDLHCITNAISYKKWLNHLLKLAFMQWLLMDDCITLVNNVFIVV